MNRKLFLDAADSTEDILHAHVNELSYQKESNGKYSQECFIYIFWMQISSKSKRIWNELNKYVYKVYEINMMMDIVPDNLNTFFSTIENNFHYQSMLALLSRRYMFLNEPSTKIHKTLCLCLNSSVSLQQPEGDARWFFAIEEMKSSQKIESMWKFSHESETSKSFKGYRRKIFFVRLSVRNEQRNHSDLQSHKLAKQQRV